MEVQESYRSIPVTEWSKKDTVVKKVVQTELRPRAKELSFSINLEQCMKKYNLNSSQYQSTLQDNQNSLIILEDQLEAERLKNTNYDIIPKLDLKRISQNTNATPPTTNRGMEEHLDFHKINSNQS
jgi:hypothetical protein